LENLLKVITPDILLFDVNLNGENSFALVRRIKDRYPDIRILMVSAFGDAHLLQRSIRAGATGYALKSVSMSDLPAAIRQLFEKGTYFSPDLSEHVLGGLGHTGKISTEITQREAVIIRLIAQGLTNIEIAHEIAVSVHTVKFHVSHLLQQYQFRRRSELVKLSDNFR
jgi:DNA-binding NarL/FixJ family response regulator